MMSGGKLSQLTPEKNSSAKLGAPQKPESPFPN